MEIRLLTAREIECRVSMIRKSGIQLLLYKDARVDMAILDEIVGPMNWQRHHTRDNANCIISIWDDEKACWVDKEDVGTESNTEAQKGLASDSFKRAGVNWGIGRELYTAPFIWIDKANCEIKEDNGRLKCNDRFEVKEIGYNEHREINRLVIVNSKTGNVVYEYGTDRKEASKASNAKVNKDTKAKAESAEKPAGTPQKATDEQIEYIKRYATDDHYMEIMTMYGAELENLTYEDAERISDEIVTRKLDTPTTCERCGKIITGIALPDGSTMTGGEIVGKSKLTYGGVYCFTCMKELKKLRSKAG